MTAQLRLPLLAVLAACFGAFLSSCTYEPYSYGPRTSVGSSVSYSSNGHVSSSVFIRTSSSRWGYDPHCRSYYDYHRKAYYCPWLRGYYPTGFRPPVVVGVPHPHGWHPGRSSCAAPTHVRNHSLRDYRNRHLHLSRLNHSWCKGLRTGSHSNHHSNRNHYNHSSHRHHSNHQSRDHWNTWNRSFNNHQSNQHRNHHNRSSQNETCNLNQNHRDRTTQHRTTQNRNDSHNRTHQNRTTQDRNHHSNNHRASTPPKPQDDSWRHKWRDDPSVIPPGYAIKNGPKGFKKVVKSPG